MRKILISVGSLTALLIFSFFAFDFEGFESRYVTSPYFKKEETILVRAAQPVLDAVNAKNAGIKSLVCDDLKVRIHNNRVVRLHGGLAYEKDRKFRLTLDSVVSSELDIGSDGRVFWFWSRRLDDPALYWARYEDLSKTKLKAPFNPYWLGGTLGADVIDYADATIDRTGDIWRVVKTSKTPQNQPATVVTLVDPARQAVVGSAVYDARNKLVAASEIQEFQKIGDRYLPAKINYNWTEEGVQVNWYLGEIRVNAPVSRWTMPAVAPKINMAD